MEKYISNFDTTPELATFSGTSDCLRPHVSLTNDTAKVHYFESALNGHGYVEIGGTKWAKMNIGANSVTDYGLYFQWGDTQGYEPSEVGIGNGKKYFHWQDTKYWTGNTGSGSSGFTKYNTTDSKTVLDASDDVAIAIWGGNWRMPTTAEFQALSGATNANFTSDYQGSGVAGLVLTDKTDSSKILFFPSGGDIGLGSVKDIGAACGYWSKSLKTDDVRNARALFFRNPNIYWDDTSYRYCGFLIRPVIDL